MNYLQTGANLQLLTIKSSNYYTIDRLLNSITRPDPVFGGHNTILPDSFCFSKIHNLR